MGEGRAGEAPRTWAPKGMVVVRGKEGMKEGGGGDGGGRVLEGPRVVPGRRRREDARAGEELAGAGDASGAGGRALVDLLPVSVV